MATVEPLAKDKRHRADYRDDIEHAEVAGALSELPEDHPARRAYSAGETTDSLSMSHQLAERPELVKRLIDAYLAHSERMWARNRRAPMPAQPGS
jgi:hypothetical protein